jgi:anhydro-N-acetylmuramic acid kinase
MQARGGARYDVDGKLAAAGTVDEAVLRQLLAHPYFTLPGPKSLDRYDFPLTPVEALSVEDGAATLTAFTAETVALAVRSFAKAPTVLIACGGGRHNPTLMAALRSRVGIPLQSAEDAGWRGDSIEAEAFAYLAARTARGLPISFPGTTAVKAPMVGGVIVQP